MADLTPELRRALEAVPDEWGLGPISGGHTYWRLKELIASGLRGAAHSAHLRRLLRALDEALDFGCPDLEWHGEGACPPGIRCASRPFCEANAQRRAGA